VNVPPIASLAPFVGLILDSVGHAADMLTLTFRKPTEDPSEGSRLWCLHIQCPWRVESDGALVTGSSDWWETEDNLSPPDGWDPAEGGSLQVFRLAEILGDRAPERKKGLRNRTVHFVVTSAESGNVGDLVLTMTGGFLLRAFPAGWRGERWRIFEKGNTESHRVCSGESDSTTA
jgi:hypothetical protein